MSKEKLERIESVACTSTKIVASVALLFRIDFPILILIITAPEDRSSSSMSRAAINGEAGTLNLVKLPDLLFG